MKLRLFALLSCLYLLGASREQPWGDANVVYSTAQGLLERGHIDVNMGGPPQFYSSRNGKKYGVFPLGNVIAHLPSYAVYKALRLLPHKAAVEPLLFRLCSHLSSSLLMAGACVLLMVMLRREGASARLAAWLAAVAGGATILAVYARVPYSEALQTLAFTWVVERTFTVGDRPTARAGLWLGVACGLLFNTKLVYALCLPVVPVYILWLGSARGRGPETLRALLFAALPLFVLCAFAVWHNHLKTGTYFDTGYRIPDGVFSGEAYAALYGFYLSPGKSLFLYSPPLVLGALALPSYLRSHRPHALFLCAISAVVVLMNASFRYWHADYCWGPRLLAPLTAAWLLPVGPWLSPALRRGRARLRALGVGALVGVGLLVQVLGASLYWDHYIRMAIAVKDQTGASGWYTEDLHHCHFIPQFSPLVGHAWLLRHLYQRDANLLVDAPWRRVIAGKVDVSAEWSATHLDWWVWEWRQTPEARLWLWALLAVLLGGATAAVVAGRRRPARARSTAPLAPLRPEPVRSVASGAG